MLWDIDTLTFRPPVADEDEDGTLYDWYYSQTAGEYVLTFGKHRGKKIHETSLDYLYWYEGVVERRNDPALLAFRRFHDGLEEYVKANYEDIAIPFGRKHRGETIRQCRDKKWLTWTLGQKELRRKYGVFFTAVKLWLQNPRHQCAKRDIGELLDASNYEDDLRLQQQAEEDDEEATLSDREFIVLDSEISSDDQGHDTTEDELAGAGRRTSQSESEDVEMVSTSGTCDESEKVVNKRSHARKRGDTSQSSEGSFIEDDEEKNGSDEYHSRAIDSEPTVETPTRQLRSNAQKEPTKRNVVLSPYRMHRHLRDTGSSMTPSPRESPRKRTRRNVIQSPTESEDEVRGNDRAFEPRTPPCSGSESSTDRHHKRREKPSNAFTSMQVDAPAMSKGKRKHEALLECGPAFQARKIAEYFESAPPRLKLPPDVSRALNTIYFYVDQQQSSIDIVSDADSEAVVQVTPSKQMRGQSSRKRRRVSEEL